MIPRPELILVLDDDVHAAACVAGLLELRGYRTVVAHNCDAAIKLALQHHPHLLLSDVNLPCKNGLECVQELQAAGLLDIPVIFVSAMARLENIQAGLRAGARDYITKPFTPEQLLRAVETHIRAA